MDAQVAEKWMNGVWDTLFTEGLTDEQKLAKITSLTKLYRRHVQEHIRSDRVSARRNGW